MSNNVTHQYAHHFESADHEFESCKQGMWLFLMQEVLFFSALFVGYAIFKTMYPEAFFEAHKALDWKLGGLNTIILIASSFTMALAVNAAQTGQKNKQILNLILTLLFAGGFLVVKYFEYTHKFHMGIFPAEFFQTEQLIGDGKLFSNPDVPVFFSFYFAITGLHGLHVLIGMFVILWILKRAMNGEFGPSYYTPVEMVGLYWHFVDLVWIYLFPLLYLLG